MAAPDFFYGDPYVVNPERPIQAWIKDHGAVSSEILIHEPGHLIKFCYKRSF